MRARLLTLSMCNSQPIIKNGNFNVCKNCAFFKTDMLNIEIYGRCHKFGDKDIITSKIKYDFAYACREDEKKCGIEGRYFEENKYPYLTRSNLSLFGIISFFLYSIFK